MIPEQDKRGNLIPAGEGEGLLQFEILTSPEKIIALIDSRQFTIIYDRPLPGDDRQVLGLLQQCEDFVYSLRSTPNLTSLALVVPSIDSGLIPCLPAEESRAIIRAIAERDVSLVQYMPQVRQMLWRVYRAIEMSWILDPDVLERIRVDVANQKVWSAV